MLKLRYNTSPAWLDAVLSDFDTFLIDHAANERKVSSSNMSFVVRYPDRPLILEQVIKMAREELEHFHRVYKLIVSRGLQLGPDTKDEYVNMMIQNVRHGRDERFLDRLLLSGILEARGCERLGIITEALEDNELKEFYQELTRCEARHHSQFIQLAGLYFDEKTISKRMDELLDIEAEAIAKAPIRPALH